jgi:hypothetical protein
MAGQFGMWFRLPRKLQGSFTSRKFATWDRRLYFPSEGRHAVDFLKKSDGFGRGFFFYVGSSFYYIIWIYTSQYFNALTSVQPTCSVYFYNFSFVLLQCRLLALYLIVLPVRILTHWGIGPFCINLFASFLLILNVLCADIFTSSI